MEWKHWKIQCIPHSLPSSFLPLSPGLCLCLKQKFVYFISIIFFKRLHVCTLKMFFVSFIPHDLNLSIIFDAEISGICLTERNGLLFVSNNANSTSSLYREISVGSNIHIKFFLSLGWNVHNIPNLWQRLQNDYTSHQKWRHFTVNADN